jgi:hypothetical protein
MAGQLYYQLSSGVWVPVGIGLAGGEPALGNPAVNGYVLSSTTAGVRSWVAGGSGSSFTTNSKMSMSADQTLAHKTWTKAVFDTVVFDADSECSTVNNTWTCTTTGTYIIHAVLSYKATYNSGLRSVAISEDGNAPGMTSYFNQVISAGTLATTRPFVVGQIACTAGQAISIWGYQSNDSVATLDIDSDGCYFSVFRIA